MSDTITIICNGVPRDIVDGWETTAAERAELDYVDWDAVERGEDSFSGFRYLGELYDLSDIPAVDRRDGFESPFQGWDGVMSDSFFSGIVVRYCDDDERVIVGRFFC